MMNDDYVIPERMKIKDITDLIIIWNIPRKTRRIGIHTGQSFGILLVHFVLLWHTLGSCESQKYEVMVR